MNDTPENVQKNDLPPVEPMEAPHGGRVRAITAEQNAGVPGSGGARQWGTPAARGKVKGNQAEDEAVLRQQCGTPVQQTPCRHWLTSDDLAASLGVAEKTVRNMARRGDIPGHKLPPNSSRGQWRFDPEEVDRSIRSQKPAQKRSRLTVW